VRLRPLLAFLVVAAVAMAGCGVASEGRATLAQPGDVPYDLLTPAAPATTTTAHGPAGPATTVTVYFVQGGRLAPAERRVTTPVALDRLVQTLAAGPTEAEITVGLRTALLAVDVVRSVLLAGGIATVDLAASFTEAVGQNQLLALAQMVFTLTERPGVGRVGFTLEGSPVGVPRGDGAVTLDSVSRDDYSGLSPLPQG
jgi:spore germination protein GerM